MTTIVHALAAEPLDALVWRTTGRGIDAVPAVLAANPGIAPLGAALPEGRAVVLPDLPATAHDLSVVQLWD